MAIHYFFINFIIIFLFLIGFGIINTTINQLYKFTMRYLILLLNF